MSAYSALVLSHGSLVVYYRLGESSGFAQDSGPNGLHIDTQAGYTYGQAGALVNDADTAILFDGTTNRMSTPDNNALDYGDGPVSYECWVKRTATQGAVQTLITKGASTLQLRFAADDKIAVLRQGTALPGMAVSSGTLTDTSAWHHIVVTKASGAAPKIYLDGADVTVAETNQTLSSSTAALSIGAAVTATRFPGYMDEVAVYSAVLTPDEVLQHYRVGRALLTPATETDSAVALDKDKQRTVGVGAETDSAQALDVDKTKALISAAETDAAQAFTPSKAPTLGVAAETDAAQALSVTKTIFKSITPASESDAAEALTASKSVSLASSSETDAAEALDADKQATLGVASETDTAGVLSRTGYIVPASETDEAQALSYSVLSPSGGGGIEFRPKLRRPLKVAQLWPIWPAYERDTAVELTYTKKPSQIQLEDDELLLLA